jgi:hypothetical protein
LEIAARLHRSLRALDVSGIFTTDKGLAALKALTALQIGTSCVSRLLSSDVLGEWSYVQCEIRPPNITIAGVRQVLREC